MHSGTILLILSIIILSTSEKLPTIRLYSGKHVCDTSLLQLIHQQEDGSCVPFRYFGGNSQFVKIKCGAHGDSQMDVCEGPCGGGSSCKNFRIPHNMCITDFPGSGMTFSLNCEEERRPGSDEFAIRFHNAQNDRACLKEWGLGVAKFGCRQLGNETINFSCNGGVIQGDWKRHDDNTCQGVTTTTRMFRAGACSPYDGMQMVQMPRCDSHQVNLIK